MNQYKSLLLHNWHFMRFFRLGAGLLLAYQAIVLSDYLAGGIAAFFLFQAITNTGCCGTSGCSVPSGSSQPRAEDEVKYEDLTKK